MMTETTQTIEAVPAAPAMKSAEVPFAGREAKSPPVEEKPKPAETVEAVNSAEEADNPDEGAEDDGQDDAVDEQQQKELPRGVRRKLAKQNNKIARQALEIAALQAQMQQAQAFQQQRPQEVPSGAPRLEDYDFDHDRYTRALHEHWQREQEVTRKVTSYEQRVTQYAAEDPNGWLEAISAPIDYSQPMLDAIMESDIGPKIGVYLARNLNEAMQIAQMSPASAIRAIGKIEAKLEAPVPKPEKKTTAAPPPPSTVTGSSGVSKDINDPNLTTAERIALFKARRAKP